MRNLKGENMQSTSRHSSLDSVNAQQTVATSEAATGMNPALFVGRSVQDEARSQKKMSEHSPASGMLFEELSAASIASELRERLSLDSMENLQSLKREDRLKMVCETLAETGVTVPQRDAEAFVQALLEVRASQELQNTLVELLVNSAAPNYKKMNATTRLTIKAGFAAMAHKLADKVIQESSPLESALTSLGNFQKVVVTETVSPGSVGHQEVEERLEIMREKLEALESSFQNLHSSSQAFPHAPQGLAALSGMDLQLSDMELQLMAALEESVRLKAQLIKTNTNILCQKAEYIVDLRRADYLRRVKPCGSTSFFHE